MDVKKTLKKQGHRFVGSHSCVKICRWTRKSLVDEGECYKEKFYGIDSHRCCQMSPFLDCQNMCLHCWRPIEIDFGKGVKGGVDNVNEIIDGCIEEQRKLLTGFKGNDKVNKEKLKEAWEPVNFAVSLIGEPLLYPKIGRLIEELHRRGKTSFVVTNGLSPNVLRELSVSGLLPTQLYISMNAPNKKLFDKWHQSKVEGAWEKYNESLRVMSELDCRRVIRMTLVKGENSKDEMVDDYVGLIEKSGCDFIEVKGFMSVGFSRKRFGYDKMPRHSLVREYAEKIVNKLDGYEIIDEHERSAVVLIGKKGVEKILKK